jgi:hypothetical protein
MESTRNLQVDESVIRRIEAIERSLQAFVLGWFGVLPILGIVPAIRTLWISNRIRSRLGRQWNPGSGYLNCGVALSILGLVASSLIIGVLIIELGWLAG